VSFACGLREPRTLWRGPEVTRAAGEAPRGVVPYGLCELAALSRSPCAEPLILA